MDLLEQVQSRVMESIKGLEHIPYKARLFSLEKGRLCGDPMANSQDLKGAVGKLERDSSSGPAVEYWEQTEREEIKSVPNTPCPVTAGPDEESLSSFPTAPFRSCEFAMGSPNNLPFSRLNSPSCFSLAL
ncbi:hypothetical protein TURU_091925 [Turdus rufiventris]|nr:hypothetical protein TURU_091925 [Turdus rufiventris]